MSRIIRRLRHDDGVTLTELMVVLMLMGIVAIIFSTAIVAALRSTRNVEGVARSNDDVRLAIATLDRELRSASQICAPGPATSGDTLTFETRAASGTETITYRINDPDADGVGTLVKVTDAAGERVVVDGVVNGFVAAENGTPEPMFTNQGITEAVGPSTTVTGSPSFGKVISLRVWVDANPRDDISPKLETTELSGRNVWTPNAGCS